jgi:hypothetical protein
MDKKTTLLIINALRKATISWEGRKNCLNRGRRKKLIGKLKNGKDKFVWENNCESCNTWHDQKENSFEVDHISEVGGFKGDWNQFIPRMFCDESNLQRLCISCHSKKTSSFNATLRYQRKSSEIDPLDFL